MIKPAIFAALGALTATTLLASAAQAQEVEIRNAVARVVVIPEDRTDIQVSVDAGSSTLPAIEVRRRGRDVLIEGGLRRQIGNCRSSDFVADPTQMPAGVQVTVRDHGTIEMADAPLIVIRTPMDVSLNAEGAVWGAIGRSASAELGAGGCGDWSVANTTGELSIAIGGSGDVRAGTARTAEIAIGGSGTVRVRGGQAPQLDVAVAGSGDVVFDGEAGNLDVSIVGSGDVTVRRATGSVDRTILGSGDLNVGS